MLFSGASLELGKIHWYIQKADTEMNEVGFDEIHWWVFKKETNVEKLLKKSEEALKSVQKSKEDSFELKTLTLPILGNKSTEHEVLHAVFTNCTLVR